LHNYLMWQLINNYIDDLSWDYVHARRDFINTMYGTKDASSGYANCFQVVGNYATNILEQIKEEMYQAISSFSWMTDDNKQSAKTKVKEGLYKIGYPDFMVNDTYMDSLHSIITINESDYFSNVVSLNLISRQKFSDLIAKPNSKTLWAYSVYAARIEYYNPWHELIATAGMIQSPLFAHNGPAYYNFGGVGSLLARSLIHAVDEIGSIYKLDQTNPGIWWSQFTQQHFKDIKQCAIDAQKDTPIGPFVVSEGSSYTPNSTFIASAYVPELLADASGLKLSYKAYNAKMTRAGTEKIPAGFPNYSLNKLFFIAFAQINVAYFGNYNFHSNAMFSVARVNMAVSQLQEFRDTFGCKVGDPMAPAKTCTLF
ncbi:unnamed protein product, partial [Candidula unifasciata]